MHGGDFFYQAFVYLSAAVVAVPIAKKLGFGSVLGYLMAGIIIGPFLLGLVGEEGQDVMHFAEFGVVMMLFLVGLEVQPALLWKLRSSILGIGGVQVLTTAGIITLVTVLVSPYPWQTGLAIGLTLALSSTAIVMQTLSEKGLLKTEGGQNAFSVLLFQDIAVIPILAFLPLLAAGETKTDIVSKSGSTWVENMAMIPKTVIILAVITAIIAAGRYLISPAFRLIAQTRLRELFTAAALLLIISITLLMTKVGLSPALGTFLAGVILAQSEYRHELEVDIEPFKGLLLGLFFIAVGASIDFDFIGQNPGLIAALVGGLITIKLIILVIIGRVAGMRLDSNLLFTFALAQGGEFAFVLLSFALQNNVMGADLVDPLIAAVAVSMALTPLLMLFNEKLIQPRFGTTEKPKQEDESIAAKCPVIIAGFGRYGSTIGRFMQANGIQATYLDIDPNNVELLRKMGLKVFYGDASRHSLLATAGAEDARMLIVAVDSPDKGLEIVNTAQKHFPHLKIIARTKSWNDSYMMLDAGVDHVHREYLDGALRMAADALSMMGYRKYPIQRAVKTFRKHDEHFLRELAELHHDHPAFIESIKEKNEDLERMMLDDLENMGKDKDRGWDNTSLKEEFSPMVRQFKSRDKKQSK